MKGRLNFMWFVVVLVVVGFVCLMYSDKISYSIKLRSKYEKLDKKQLNASYEYLLKRQEHIMRRRKAAQISRAEEIKVNQELLAERMFSGMGKNVPNAVANTKDEFIKYDINYLKNFLNK